MNCESDRATVNTDVIGKDSVRCSVHFITWFEPAYLFAHAFDNPEELDDRAAPYEGLNEHQNHVILWLNHGPNLSEAKERRLDQKM